MGKRKSFNFLREQWCIEARGENWGFWSSVNNITFMSVSLKMLVVVIKKYIFEKASTSKAFAHLHFILWLTCTYFLFHNLTGSLDCCYCEKTFSNTGNRATHETFYCKLNPDRKIYQCRYCYVQSPRASRIKIHMNEVHLTGKQEKKIINIDSH